MFHQLFANPWAFYLLGAMPVLSLLGLWAARRRRCALAQLGHLRTLQMLISTPTRGRVWRALLFSLGTLLLITGIAGPQWGRDYSQAVAPGRDLVVVLDLSRSMLAEQPSRLHRAQQALADLVQTLKQRGGHRVGLVVFAARTKVACPLTHDYDHFAEVVAGLEADRLPPEIAATGEEESGTRIGAALRRAADLHDARFRGYQDILLLSDGDDPARDGEWRLPAAEARALGIPVHTFGIGNPDADSTIPLRDGQVLEYDGKPVPTRLQEAPLQEIAEITAGQYVAAHTRVLPLGRFFRETIEPRPLRDDTEEALPLYRQRYPWFLGGALLLLAAEMALGQRPRSSRLPVVLPAPQTNKGAT